MVYLFCQSFLMGLAVIETMAIGIDVGGSKIAAAIIDQDYNLLATTRLETPQSYPEFLQAVQTVVARIEQEGASILVNRATSLPVGMCLPGFIDPQTGPIAIANIPNLAGQPLLADLSRLLSRPLRLMNDAQAFLLSAARDIPADRRAAGPVFGAILGTGVGGGLMIEGRIIPGFQGAAGEWGQIAWPGAVPDPWHPARLAATKTGRIEDWLGLHGLLDLARHIRPGHHTPHDITAALHAGEEWAQKVRACYAARLAQALAVIVLFIDPAVIVLGGGVAQMPGLAVLTEACLRRLLPLADSNITLSVAHDADHHSLIGAACLWLG